MSSASEGGFQSRHLDREAIELVMTAVVQYQTVFYGTMSQYTKEQPDKTGDRTNSRTSKPNYSILGTIQSFLELTIRKKEENICETIKIEKVGKNIESQNEDIHLKYQKRSQYCQCFQWRILDYNSPQI